VAEIEFRLLGPLEVWRDGRRLEVGGAKPRTLLAMLLLHAGRVVSTDRLIDALWGEDPPPSGLNALQRHVAYIRRTLESERARGDQDGLLFTRPPGYMIRVDDDALDVLGFERLLEHGRDALAEDPAAAAELLRAALALWRGPALADFAFDQFARAEAARLEELRLAALEDRIEAHLRLGRHHELVPELEALTGEHPFRERLAAQLMTALYRCERQADASRVYHATRASLVEELGIEPGVALRQVHQRVLDQDPALRSVQPSGEVRRVRRAAPSAAGTLPHNLPVELTSFVGRERELGDLSELLHSSRLLTLTGPGGSGKTRLALRLARNALHRYPDGVWLVELAPLGDPALVTKAVAAALAVREGPEPLMETLTRRLRSARLLLVLDNCEHVVGACAGLAHTLLTACDGLRILATSREPLTIAGERTWPVPGLALPDPLTSPAELGRYAAVRLFAERAAAGKPTFVLDEDNAAAAAEVCRRLDGMPLAIELAAARVRVLSPDEISERLNDRFALLTGGNRAAASRQRTLRATVDWSYDLLGADERTLFRRLSVFAGGWTAVEAEQICADERLPKHRIFEALCALVEKSLVVGEALAEGSTRYRMLETLREYGHEQLTAAGELDELRRRHFTRFLELAERSRQQKLTTGGDAGLAVLVSEQDNLRAALAFAHGDDALGLLRLATAMDQLWHAGNLVEGRRWLKDALAQSPEPGRERARALHALASLADLQQDHDAARRSANEAIALASRFGDEAGEAWARVTLGMIEFTAENYAEASRQLEQALAMHEVLGQRLGVERARIFLGVGMTMDASSRDRGRKQLQDALRLAQELDDRWGEGFSLFFLGLADLDGGDRGLATARFRGALMAEALGPIRAGPLEGLAALACERDPGRTLRLMGAATSLRERHGGRPPPVIKRRAAAVRARAEQQLDQDMAEQAWNEGLRMTTDEAIGYALEDRQHRTRGHSCPGR
jgi:predicted ATPase/DNA-binding SARP family transcriptional activator